jgi:quinol monooxygenase YgiN
MPAPFIFITTHKINPGKLDEFKALSREYEEFVRANEPDLLAYYAYLDEDSSEAALVQVHRDAASAEHHMQVAAEKIGQGLAITTTVRAEVYGQPRSIVGQALGGEFSRGCPGQHQAGRAGRLHSPRIARAGLSRDRARTLQPRDLSRHRRGCTRVKRRRRGPAVRARPDGPVGRAPRARPLGGQVEETLRSRVRSPVSVWEKLDV